MLCYAVPATAWGMTAGNTTRHTITKQQTQPPTPSPFRQPWRYGAKRGPIVLSVWGKKFKIRKIKMKILIYFIKIQQFNCEILINKLFIWIFLVADFFLSSDSGLDFWTVFLFNFFFFGLRSYFFFFKVPYSYSSHWSGLVGVASTERGVVKRKLRRDLPQSCCLQETWEPQELCECVHLTFQDSS